MLPSANPALAVRAVAETVIRRRLMVITRDGPTAPALTTFLAAGRDQARRLVAG